MTYIVPPPADQAPARSRCGYDSSNDVRGGLPWARAAPARCATSAVVRTARTSSLVAPSPPNSSGRRRSDAASSCSRSEPVTAFSQRSSRAGPVASSRSRSTPSGRRVCASASRGLRGLLADPRTPLTRADLVLLVGGRSQTGRPTADSAQRLVEPVVALSPRAPHSPRGFPAAPRGRCRDPHRRTTAGAASPARRALAHGGSWPGYKMVRVRPLLHEPIWREYTGCAWPLGRRRNMLLLRSGQAKLGGSEPLYSNYCDSVSG